MLNISPKNASRLQGLQFFLKRPHTELWSIQVFKSDLALKRWLYKYSHTCAFYVYCDQKGLSWNTFPSMIEFATCRLFGYFIGDFNELFAYIGNGEGFNMPTPSKALKAIASALRQKGAPNV